MVTPDFRAPFLDDDMDAGHVVPLLYPGAQLELFVQTSGTAIDIGAVLPRRIEVLDSDDR